MRTIVIGICFVALGCGPDAEPTATEAPVENPEPVTEEPLDDPVEAPVDDPIEDPVEDPTPAVAEYPEVVGVPLAVDEDPEPGRVEVSLTAAPSDIELVSGTQTAMWTYNGQLPGPVIQAKVGDTVVVHLQNDLPEATTIHWHGMRVPNAMDGTPRTQDPILPGESFTYEFVVEDAGTFWYHPHFSTDVQVERGLYGVILVHEDPAPAYDVERIVFLDDILLNAANQLEPFVYSHPVRMHGRNGNVLLMNGKAVEGNELMQMRRGAVERWRILNSANARTAYFDVSEATWSVIGWDGGLIPAPYTPDLLRVSPGERYDVEVRWDQMELGSSGEVRYWVPTIQRDQVVLAPITLTTLMTNGQPPLEARGQLLPEITLPEVEPADQATLLLKLSGENIGGTIEWQINGKPFAKADAYEIPLDTVHTIDIENTQGQEHPFHIHGHFFRVISRNGVPEPHDGLKDTVYVGGHETVRVVLDFDNPGGWMAHCHILEHAELGMMSLFEVVE